MNFEEQMKRYNNDPLFYTYVKMIVNFLEEGKLTVSELRDAATLAGIIFESQRVRPNFPNRGEFKKWSFIKDENEEYIKNHNDKDGLEC